MKNEELEKLIRTLDASIAYCKLRQQFRSGVISREEYRELVKAVEDR